MKNPDRYYNLNHFDTAKDFMKYCNGMGYDEFYEEVHAHKPFECPFKDDEDAISEYTCGYEKAKEEFLKDIS